jgi:hypothetical protein
MSILKAQGRTLTKHKYAMGIAPAIPEGIAANKSTEKNAFKS